MEAETCTWRWKEWRMNHITCGSFIELRSMAKEVLRSTMS